MDPPTSTLMNTSPFNLSEIWPIPINGATGDLTGPGLDLRRGPLGPNLGRFVEPVQNHREVSGSEGVGPKQSGGSARKRRENSTSVGVADDDLAKGVCTGMSDNDAKRLKPSGSGDDNPNPNPKVDGEVNSGKGTDQKGKPPAEPPKDYIHVRARRGQATDSHSLAERARREKISERMRILQDLVPGCNKVIGKALVLDEIINYIQSLQRQVEFLSMKLEAVNTRVTPSIEGFPAKDFDTGKHSFAASYKLQGAPISSEFGQHAFDPSAVVYGSQAPREYGRGSSPEWLHMQVGGGFERQT